MKSCPSCLTQYTDDTLQYCLQDGTPLVSSPQADVPTVVLGETETFVPRRRDDVPLETNVDLREAADIPRSVASAGKPRSNTAIVVLATALVMLFVLGALGLAGYLYLRDRDIARNTNDNANRDADRSGDNSENRSSPRPPATPSPTLGSNTNERYASNSFPSKSSTPTPDRGETREELIGLVNEWRSETEDMDIDSLMSRYASRVDYYNRRGANVNFIRADKNRAFSRYDDIRIDVSDFSVTTNEAADTATVEFDKRWRFEGARSSSGRVRQMLQLKKINGRWLITAERDVKVF